MARRSIYLAALLVVLSVAFLAAASAAQDDVTTPPPPPCPANAKQETLHAGTTPEGGPLYFRFCGRARFTARFADNAIRVRGFCGPPTVPVDEPTTAYRWLLGGLIANAPEGAAGRGLMLVLEGPRTARAGVVQVIDGEFQVPGVDSALDGTAIVGKKWQHGHFWVKARNATPESFNGVIIAGSWDCGPK